MKTNNEIYKALVLIIPVYFPGTKSKITAPIIGIKIKLDKMV